VYSDVPDEYKKLYELAQKEPREALCHWNLRIKIATNQPRIVLKKSVYYFYYTLR